DPLLVQPLDGLLLDLLGAGDRLVRIRGPEPQLAVQRRCNHEHLRLFGGLATDGALERLARDGLRHQRKDLLGHGSTVTEGRQRTNDQSRLAGANARLPSVRAKYSSTAANR